MSASKELWTEKYRPNSLSSIILPERIKQRFANGLDTNILLAGTQGTGKTTLAKILSQGRSVLTLNASLENGVDAVRNSIIDFASTTSMINRNLKKVVFLDEADNLSDAAQKGLRGAIEKFHKNVVFIFTCNYAEKIIEPLRNSRLELIEFDFTDDEEREMLQNYIIRIRQILQHNKRTISNDALKFLIKTRYPDMRSILTTLQSISNNVKEGSEIALEDVRKIKTSKYQDLYDFLLTEQRHDKIYQFVRSKYLNKESFVLQALGSDFLKYLVDNDKADKVGFVSIITHKYMFESTDVPDKLISLVACCASIAEIFKR